MLSLLSSLPWRPYQAVFWAQDSVFFDPEMSRNLQSMGPSDVMFSVGPQDGLRKNAKHSSISEILLTVQGRLCASCCDHDVETFPHLCSPTRRVAPWSSLRRARITASCHHACGRDPGTVDLLLNHSCIGMGLGWACDRLHQTCLSRGQRDVVRKSLWKKLRVCSMTTVKFRVCWLGSRRGQNTLELLDAAGRLYDAGSSAPLSMGTDGNLRWVQVGIFRPFWCLALPSRPQSQQWLPAQCCFSKACFNRPGI